MKSREIFGGSKTILDLIALASTQYIDEDDMIMTVEELKEDEIDDWDEWLHNNFNNLYKTNSNNIINIKSSIIKSAITNNKDPFDSSKKFYDRVELLPISLQHLGSTYDIKQLEYPMHIIRRNNFDSWFKIFNYIKENTITGLEFEVCLNNHITYKEFDGEQ